MSNWKLDSVDFQDYGVYISRSSGVLDIPKIQNAGFDWLDENGKQYQEAIVKLESREIVLTCWIYTEASSPLSAYQVFTNKVNAFHAALMAAGTRTLTTPFGDISNVTVQSGAVLVRGTNYVMAQQVGTFTLRLTVSGDTKYKTYTVYNPSGYAAEYILTNNLQVNRTLQGESYATCSIEANSPLTVDMYYYIMVNTNGVNTEPYYFMYKPETSKVSTNKFTYNLRLEHGSVLLKQSQFHFEGISDFEMFADLDMIIDLVVTNADRFISGKFSKGTIETGYPYNIKKNHTFKGEDCYSVVQRMAQEYGLEFDVKYTNSLGGHYYISVEKQIATTKSITLQYGKGNGLYDLSREPANRDKLVTVLYAYGSTKNLKPDYRSGKPRLEFTGNPLRQNDTLYMGVEDDVFFDDIYPQRTAAVIGYTQVLKCEETDPGWAAYAAIKEIWPGGMYRVEDNTCFDINAYLLNGLTAKIRMKTGDLAGYEFEIVKYDHVPGHIFIKPYKDKDGYMLPNETLMIASGDEYTLVDIDQPTSYVEVAEAELLAAATEYLEKYSTPEYPYKCRVDPIFLSGTTNRFDVGDKVTVVDTDFGINGQYRISQLTYNDYTGVYELTLSENRILNRRERQQIAIERIDRTIEGTDAQAVETIRKDKETVGELRNRIFDPADDLQSLNDTVRNESVDARMMGYDTGTPMFMLRGMVIDTSGSGNPNQIIVGAGSVYVMNWAELTKSRYEIQKLRDQSVEYHPERQWTYAGGTITIPDDREYLLYAVLQRDETQTTLTLELRLTPIYVKQYMTELWYPLGALNVQASPRSAAMLWGNVKYAGGTSLPAGGTTGQALRKASDNNYDATWQDDPLIDPRLLGGGTLIYLHAEDATVTGYKKAVKDLPEVATVSYQATANVEDSEVLIKSFVTDAGFPGAKEIPAGAWVFSNFCAVTNTNECKLVICVFKRAADNTETELFNTEDTITSLSVASCMVASAQDSFTLAETDRLVVKYYFKNSSESDITIDFAIEGNTAETKFWANIRFPYVAESSGTGTDEKVKLTADDASAGYLTDKLAGVDAAAVDDTSTFNFIKTVKTVATLVKITWANLKSALKTYFDGIYAALGHVHTFLSLSDTPSAYTDQAGKVVVVKGTEDGLEFTDPSGGADTFLELTDTPAAYTGQAGKFVKVKATEDGVEFDTPGAGDFATRALDNLASTAVNASIIPGVDSSVDLGSSTKYWANLYVDTIYSPAINGSADANGDITIQGTTHATRSSSFVIIQPNGGRVQMGIATAADTLFNLTNNAVSNTTHQLFVENINTGGRTTFGMNSGTYPNHDVGIVLEGTGIVDNEYPSCLGAANDAGKAIIHWSGSSQTEVILGTNTIIPMSFYINKVIKMTITNNGVGIGTYSPLTRIDLGTYVATNSILKAGSFEIGCGGLNSSYISDNAYYNLGWKYRKNGYAVLMNLNAGYFNFVKAATGTADNAITWINLMQLGSGTNDYLGISTTANPVARLDLGLHVTNKSIFKAGSLQIYCHDHNHIVIADNLYYNSAWKYRENGYGTYIYSVSGDLKLGNSPNGTKDATATLTDRIIIKSAGNIGFGVASPTAVLHLKAGTATASTAPFKFTSGTVLSSPEAGAMEYNSDDYFLTIATGAARKGIVLNDGSNLTSGKYPKATTNGRLIDGPTPLSGTKVYYVADSSEGAATRKLTFTDGILTSET